MHGIIGIVDRSTTNVSIARNLEKMLHGLSSVHSSNIEKLYTFGAAFAIVKTDGCSSKGLVAENEDVVIAFWGQLYDKKHLLTKAGQDSKSFETESIGKALLKIYSNEGIRGISNLNGRCVVALLDKKNSKLELISDKNGFCKIYYWTHGDKIIFASQAKAIIRHEDYYVESDEEAIADFMMLGYSLSEKTLFKNIKLLPYGSILTCNNKKVKIDKYWDYSFGNERTSSRAINYYVDEYFRVLKKVMIRQVAGKRNIALPISGGLDSRTMAGMLDAIQFNGNVSTFSYGKGNCFDVVYGSRIANKLGYSHKHIPVEGAYLKDNAKRFVWLTEGTVNCLNSHMLLPHELIVNENSDAVITGFLGDTVGGEPIAGVKPYQQNLDEQVFLRTIFELQIDIMTENDISVYFKPHIFNKLKGKTFETFSTNYWEAPSDIRYFKGIYAELVGRQRRYTTFNIYAFEDLTEVLSPFADAEFVEFALQIPEEFAITRQVQKEMIVKYLPKVASVAWNKTRMPLNASPMRQGFQWRWEKILKNSLVKSTIGRRYLTLDDNYLNANEAIRTSSREFVNGSIRNNPYLAEYFNMDIVHRMLDEHMNGTKNEYGKITALLTLSLWHELFLEGKQYE